MTDVWVVQDGMVLYGVFTDWELVKKVTKNKPVVVTKISLNKFGRF